MFLKYAGISSGERGLPRHTIFARHVCPRARGEFVLAQRFSLKF
jgi:hypothetical protein